MDNSHYKINQIIISNNIENDYSGTISPTEYDTAVATSEDILGNTAK